MSIGLRSLDRFPWYFRFIRSLPRNYKLRILAKKLGLWNVVCPFPFYGERQVYLPLYEKYCWLYDDMKHYHANRTGNFAKSIRDRLQDCDYIDCGANLGLWAAQIVREAGNIRHAWLFEPNTQYADIATKNMAASGLLVDVFNAAVSDYDGKARILAPNANPNPEAFYIERSNQGETDVYRLDRFRDRIGKQVAMKLDVEGEEVAVLRGASAILSAAEDFVLLIEFNRETFLRTGLDQADIINCVTGIRPVFWLNVDDLSPVDPAFDVFVQTGTKHQCDLIAVSSKPGSTS